MTKRERARAARANATAVRVAGIKEGKGGKAMAMGTRVGMVQANVGQKLVKCNKITSFY